MRGTVLSVLLLALATGGARQDAYPVAPRPLADANEIALATSAAPREISARADVYVVRATGATKLRAGTNGLACLVVRDPHPGSAYPICFDAEAATSEMRYEIFRTTLRSKGVPEADVERETAAAYARGELHPPAKPAISYMMSPRQVLFSSPYKDGRRIGAWYPHLMISMPGMTAKQLGLDASAELDVIQLDRPGTPETQLIVKLPRWADGTPVK